MNERKPAVEIVEDIDTILKEVWKHLENPEELSQDILKLAVLNGGLGNYLVEASDVERRQEAYYKHEIDKLKLNLVKAGDSATVAESKAKVEAYTHLETLLDYQHNTQVLKLKRASVDQAIDAARSRLSLIKIDIRRAD